MPAEDPRQMALRRMLQSGLPGKDPATQQQPGVIEGMPEDNPVSRMVEIQLKSDPRFSALSDEDIKAYALAVARLGGHPAKDVGPRVN
jgi:hypothetical protein